MVALKSLLTATAFASFILLQHVASTDSGLIECSNAWWRMNCNYFLALTERLAASEDVLFNGLKFCGQSVVNTATKPNLVRVYFQDEHNLVVPQLDLDKRVPSSGAVRHIYLIDTNYELRLVSEQEYYYSDLIVEYSMPNVKNIILNNKFNEDIMQKVVYIPSFAYKYEPLQNRTHELITTFVRPEIHRRQVFFEKFSQAGVKIKNFNDANDLDSLRALYDTTKILVNMHQTDMHGTFEEFRVLPALLRGVVVIAEKTALVETIPYHRFIIWCSFDDCPHVASKVVKRYDHYYKLIHGPASGLSEVLAAMDTKAFNSLGKAIKTALKKKDSTLSS